MKYLFDTNAIIALMKGQANLLRRIRRHAPSDFAIPAIVAHELYYGACRGQRVTENLRRVDALRFPVLELDREDVRRAGHLRATLAPAGAPIGPYDVLIAGQALARSLILITRNLREFQRISGLLVEDWEN